MVIIISEFGIKIKNISAGTLYDVNLGTRDYFSYTEAMLNNSLFSAFLIKNGLNVYKGESTRDIICLDFDFGTRSYEDEHKRIEQLYKNSDGELKERLKYTLEKVENNKDLYDEKKREQIRDKFYNEGVDVTYKTKNKDGSIKSEETIHYEMLFRTSAKAKLGQVIFINSELYKVAYEWLTIGLGKLMTDDNAKIVEMSAYAPLTTSTIVGTKYIPVTSKVNLATGAGLQRGDILLNEKRHVAMYCGNGLEVEASINENGRATGGKPGDQTGREFLIRSYRNYPWNVVLRYTEAADGNPPVTTKNYLAMGDKGDAVKTMQTMLIKLGYSCGKYGADGDFGSGSLASVKAFQRDNGLVADGLYGEATKAKLTTLYNAKIKAESAPKPSSKPSIASSSKVASAQSFNKSIAGTYKVKASNGLNLRYKPGDTSNSNLIITIPNGKSVANYGYYTTVNGVKWYLVTYKDTPGFVSSRYLVK